MGAWLNPYTSLENARRAGVALAAVSVILFLAWPLVVFGLAQVRSVRFVGEIVLGVVFAAFFSARMAQQYLRAVVAPVPRGSPLARSIEEVMLLAGLRRPPELALVPSRAANALIIGGLAGAPLLVITRGLADRLSPAELRGVIAHEAAHLGGPDQPLRMIGAALTNWLVWALTPRFAIRRAIFWVAVAVVAVAAPGAALAVFGGPLAVAFVEARVSRLREQVADARAVLMTREPAALADALEKLGADDEAAFWSGHGDNIAAWVLGALTTTEVRTGVPRWMAALFDPHPPLAERIDRLRAMA